jgi:uncharacterized membrane protein
VNEYDWLLFAHITGAFLLLGGAVVAGVLNIAALRRERPSEIALLFGLARFAAIAIVTGIWLTLIFGLWLVHNVGYGYGDGWIVTALILWFAGSAIGGFGGRRDRKTAELAARLAAEGDAPSPALRARVRDPVSLAASYGSSLIIVALLAIMIWKPGA